MTQFEYCPGFWSASRWWLLAIGLALTACQTSAPADQPAAQAAVDFTRADSVHAAFVAALEANDRSEVISLTVDDQQAARADTWLRMVAAYRESTTTEGPYATGGSLIRVETGETTARGAGSEGWSRWVYPRRTICYAADLAHTERGWHVTGFHTTREGCSREQ